MEKSLQHKRDIILFIDDEKICHTLIELIIPNLTNYRVVNAYNGREAVDLAKRYANNICLVLADIMLPDINGYEVFDQIRANNKLSAVPFIFQSGLDSQTEILKQNMQEKVQIIYKPYKQDDLLDAIAKALKED